MATLLNPVAATAVTGTDTITISSYVVPSGNNKKLIVNVTTDKDGVPAVVSTLEFDGNSMTKRADETSNVYSAYRCLTEVWEYDLGSSTPTGDIVCVLVDANNAGIQMGAVTADGVKQQAPEKITEGVKHDFDDSFIDTDILTVTIDALIVSIASADDDGSVAPTGTGHTEELEQNFATTVTTMMIGMVNATSITTYTLGWSGGTGTAWVNLLLAYELASADPVLDLNLFRFYDDGTESGSVAKENQNTNATVAKQTTFQLRVGAQATNDPLTQTASLRYRLVGRTKWFTL